MAWLIFLLLLIAGVAAMLIVPALFAPAKGEQAKDVRFEAGNPPFGRVRRRMAMQYLAYVYLAVAIEAVAGLAFVYYLLTSNVLDIVVAILASAATAYFIVREHGR
ncbi:NADH-quinone oxidoreductase subunit A [Thermoproteus tenax]|uniref:Ferredoxin:quinone oxidoreductase, complex I, subunit A n=1 Tax=Thermoproteus tenax (strain ATCC 35583 / DSM 2078 / JCM 9277 / NBRC 100435 / Kra 1) TaxID=768679 RepID=G4RMU8_THETK|nr:NADH-quinone oxidoreductase subunit A [Thermoproteus tenax]CCC80892.1 ferredoxin:quinone oxidoreductase, complex I, subunit A [Thermoproteus tenax Kra 1]